MLKLTDIFGHCIIPKNTFLFRGHENKEFDDCMFFATKHWVATAFHDTIQVWKTTTDIEIIFLVEYVTRSSWTISALPRLYNSIFPQDSKLNLDDLNIKHWDIKSRNELARKLFDEYKISGWLSSLENRVEMEVCLFDKQANDKQLILTDITDKKEVKYYKDSLQRIKVIPSKHFYEQTTKKLTECALEFKDNSDNYKTHRSYINHGIKEFVEEGMTKNEAKHYIFDLRTKLKI